VSLLTSCIFLCSTFSRVEVMLAVQYGINANECQALFALSAAKGLSYFYSPRCKFFFTFCASRFEDSTQNLLTQKDSLNLLNYRVAENRFCIINLISGIVETSSVSNKRWKSHNACDSRTETTTASDTNRLSCPLLFGLMKVTTCKADRWFLISDKQDSISSRSISLLL